MIIAIDYRIVITNFFGVSLDGNGKLALALYEIFIEKNLSKCVLGHSLLNYSKWIKDKSDFSHSKNIRWNIASINIF